MSRFGGWFRTLRRRLNADSVAWSEELQATRQAIGEFNDSMARCAAARGAATGLIRAMQVALDELLTNILMHGEVDSSKPITVIFDCERDWVEARISYYAPEFDPTGHSAPDITQDVGDREIGGLGLLLVTQLMDVFEHHYARDQNHLRVFKSEQRQTPIAMPAADQ